MEAVTRALCSLVCAANQALANREIGEALLLTEGTVKNYVSSIEPKIVRSRARLHSLLRPEYRDRHDSCGRLYCAEDHKCFCKPKLQSPPE